MGNKVVSTDAVDFASAGVLAANAAGPGIIKTFGQLAADLGVVDAWTKTQSDGRYASITHNHAMGDVTGLVSALAGKAAVATTLSGYGITNAYTKTEVDNLVAGLLDFKGNQDCSANPDYPPASKGDSYYVSVAGKIGGASGKSVDVGDVVVASADNAGGIEASVGASWFVLEHNLTGALVASNNLSDLANAATARSNLGLGTLATQSGTFSGTSSGTNTGDQTITLSGDVTGSGTGLITASIGALKVTNSMLAGSIALSKLSITGTPNATTYLRGDGTWSQLDSLLAGYQPLDANLTAIAALTTTTFGRSLLSLADAAAARAAIGAGTSSFSGIYSALLGIPSTFAPSAHKTSHATGGSDALTAADIGAVPTSRTLTINGTAFDLSADRSWTVSGGGGVGGSTGAVDNAVLRADGTGGSTVQNSGLIISDTLEMRIGDATDAGKLRLQDSGQYSTTALLNVFLGGAYLGQDFSTFYVRGNGEVYSYQGYTCSNSGSGFTGHQFVFEGGWGSIRRAVSTPTGNGNAIYNTYGLLVACGAGHGLSVHAGTSTTFIDVFNTFTNSTNYEKAILRFATYSSARYVQLACESAGTGIANMSLVLSPKGIGALIAGPMPDGTATGGNARGAGSVDLQLTRNAATQVASGTSSFNVGSACTASGAYSFAAGTACRALGQSSIAMGQSCVANTTGNVAIGYEASAAGFGAIALGSAVCNAGYGIAIGGRDNISNGNYSVAIGNFVTSSGTYSVAFQQCTAGGNYSWAHGLFSSADRPHLKAYAQGNFASRGDAQSVEWVVRCRTTDGSTPVTLLAEASRMTIPSGKILFATLLLVGSKSDGTAVATYMRKFAIRNRAGTTELIGAVETIGTDVTAGTSMSVAADDTNDALNVSVVGVAGETWRWLGSVYGVELTYGA